MSKVLKGLFYTSTHEWVKVEDDVAYIGISDFAQESLGTVVYIDALSEGEQLVQFSECGVIESVKAASDFISPLSGTVLEVNYDVINNPEIINKFPYESWIYKIEIANSNELSSLLSPEEYEREILK